MLTFPSCVLMFWAGTLGPGVLWRLAYNWVMWLSVLSKTALFLPLLAPLLWVNMSRIWWHLWIGLSNKIKNMTKCCPIPIFHYSAWWKKIFQSGCIFFSAGAKGNIVSVPLYYVLEWIDGDPFLPQRPLRSYNWSRICCSFTHNACTVWAKLIAQVGFQVQLNVLMVLHDLRCLSISWFTYLQSTHLKLSLPIL